MKKKVKNFFLTTLYSISSALIITNIIFPKPITKYGFGGWSITKKTFDYILATLPKGSTLLEMGSGWSSGEFSKYYTVFSVENNPKWLNKFNTNYIHVPIKDHWYNVDILRKKLPDHYDFILVDGPTGGIGRMGFYTNLKIFNTNVPILFDDIHAKKHYELFIKVAEKINRPIKTWYEKDKTGKITKGVGVVLLDSNS